MKYLSSISLVLILSVIIIWGCNQRPSSESDKEVAGDSPVKVKRVGMVIRINPEYT